MIMKRLQKKLPMLSAVGPYALTILVLVLVPVIYVAVMSVMTRPSYGGVDFTVSFNGYRSLFERAYMIAIWNSLKMSLISTVFILLIAYPMAYILSSMNKERAADLIILMMVPYFTNGLVRLYSYITLFNDRGILSRLCEIIGIPYHFDILYTETAVILGLIYVCIPYAVLPIYSSLERLNKSLAEASYDLGANRTQTFWKVIFPLSMPGVYAAAIISFVPSIGNYFVADVLGGSKTLLVGSLIKNQFLTSRNWPLGSALSLFVIGGTLIFVYLYAKVGSGEDIGGVI